MARRRALASELAEGERAAERRGRLVRHLAVVDEELREYAAPWLERIAMRTRCDASWEQMRSDGGAHVRRCARCDRDVYDLACMTRGEIEALFASASSTPCVRLRRRPDGRLVTADCPRPPASLGARAAGVLASGLLVGAAAGSAATLALRAPEAGERPRPFEQMEWAAPLERIAPTPRPQAASVALRGLSSQAAEAELDDELGEPLLDPLIEPPPPPVAQEDIDRHVRWIAPQAWEVDRDFAERLVALRPPVALRTMPVIPHEEGGRVVGLKLYGVRRASLLGRLGFQNGDLILEVNGRPFTSVEGALPLLEELVASSDALFVRLVRRGAEQVNVHRIRARSTEARAGTTRRRAVCAAGSGGTVLNAECSRRIR